MDSTAKVLVVDDEPIVLKSCNRALTAAGIAVDGVASGHDGVTRARANGFDVMLLDLKMPDMSGMEVLRAVRAIKPSLKVILITAYPSVETAVEALKLGAADYMVKPFTPHELVSTVTRVLRQRGPEAAPAARPDVVLEYQARKAIAPLVPVLRAVADGVSEQVRAIRTVNRQGQRVVILGVDGAFSPPSGLSDVVRDCLHSDCAPLYTEFGTHEVAGAELLPYLEEHERVVVLTGARLTDSVCTLFDGKLSAAVRPEPVCELPLIGFPQIASWATAVGITPDVVVLAVDLTRTGTGQGPGGVLATAVRRAVDEEGMGLRT